MKFALGDVFQNDLSTKHVRIIMFSEIQIFYEVWWNSCNDWSYRNNLKSKAIYYRASYDRFFSNAVYLRTDTLSELEIKVHRPDLPLHLCRVAQISWIKDNFTTLEKYNKYFMDELGDIKGLAELNMPEVYLVPFGVKGAKKKSVLVKAINGSQFSGLELLWQAQNTQAPYIIENIEKGVGLYRLGIEKGIPSFYIGVFYGTSDSLKRLE